MIKGGQVVELSYVLKNAKGEELDSATAESPLAYLHGYGQIIPGLEDALEGLNVGAQKSVVIPPAEAYGELNPALRLKVERSNFPPDAELEIGMQFVAEMPTGHVPFVIQKIEAEDVYIDGNHPLAGETLYFDVVVLSIREATKEEIEHGHAHGEGGHQH